jgi:serine/threonine-protein kinase
VYAAVDLTDPSGRLCVLKEGRRAGEVDWDGSDGRRRAHHEARVLRDLQHTAVRPPQVYGLFSQDGHSYLALELIAGSPLTELVEPTAEPLELSRAMTVGRQCAALLSRIHDQNWVWRDMKPSNIMVTNGELRPLDFEGAARVGSVASAPWGSPGYAPPEWLTATRIWPSQDLYALGVVLLQLFTGTPPQPGQPSPDVRTIRPEVPDQVAKIISRLTSQRPEDRGTAADAVSCLALDLP